MRKENSSGGILKDAKEKRHFLWRLPNILSPSRTFPSTLKSPNMTFLQVEPQNLILTARD
jgi:hypothetical protein